MELYSSHMQHLLERSISLIHPQNLFSGEKIMRVISFLLQKTTFFLCGVSKKKHLKAVDKLLRRTEKYFCMDQKRPCKITKIKQLQVHLITHADDSYTGSRVILQKRRHSEEVSNLERSMIGWVVLPCFL